MAPFARVDICRTFFRVPFRWNLVKFRIAREKMKIRFRRARKGCIEAESNVLVQVWIFQRSDLPTVMRLNKLSKDTDTLSMVFARPKKRHIIHCSLTTSINYPVDMHINYLVFCWAASVRAQLDFHSISSDSLATFSLLRFNKQPFLWTFSSLPNENVESLSRFFVLCVLAKILHKSVTLQVMLTISLWTFFDWDGNCNGIWNPVIQMFKFARSVADEKLTSINFTNYRNIFCPSLGQSLWNMTITVESISSTGWNISSDDTSRRLKIVSMHQCFMSPRVTNDKSQLYRTSSACTFNFRGAWLREW